MKPKKPKICLLIKIDHNKTHLYDRSPKNFDKTFVIRHTTIKYLL